MSLNVYLTKIVNYKEVCWEPVPEGDNNSGHFLMVRGRYADEDGNQFRWTAALTAIVNAQFVMGHGGKITNKNLDTVCEQFAVWQKITSPMLRAADGSDLFITREHLAPLIGLSTNCFGKEHGVAGFKRRVWNELVRQTAKEGWDAQSKGRELRQAVS
jgi:hypothetical protein